VGFFNEFWWGGKTRRGGGKKIKNLEGKFRRRNVGKEVPWVVIWVGVWEGGKRVQDVFQNTKTEPESVAINQ